MLGFAMRAGKVVIGTDLVCRGLAKRGEGRIHLVLVSESASDATKKKVFGKCEFYGVGAIEIGIDTEELGRLLGKTYAPATLGITDLRFAEEITKAHSTYDSETSTTQRKEVSFTGDR